MTERDNAIANFRKVWYNMLKFSLGVIFMTENEGKYRRWAWGAVLGLAAVIIIAIIVVGISLSSPKPTTETAKEPETTQEQPKTVATEEKKEETKTTTETKQETQDEVIKNHINKDHNANSTNSSNSSSSTSSSSSSSSSASNMPKTGPEDAVLPIFALAVSGALIAYNLTLAKKNA